MLAYNNINAFLFTKLHFNLFKKNDKRVKYHLTNYKSF